MGNGDFARDIATLKRLLDTHPNSRIRSMVHTKLDEALLWYRELLVQETLTAANEELGSNSQQLGPNS